MLFLILHATTTTYALLRGSISLKQTQNVGNKHEANCLRLDCSKLKSTFDWSPRWHIGDTIKNTVEWYKTYAAGGDLMEITQNQIAQFGQKEIKNV